MPEDPGASNDLAKEGKPAFDYGTFFFKGQSMGTGQAIVEDGLHDLYQHPWGPDHYREPALVEVGHDVEVSRAEVVEGVLPARLRRHTGNGDGAVVIGRVPSGASSSKGPIRASPD